MNALTLFQVVNSAAVSASPGVYAAPATGFSSNAAASTPASVTTAVPPQTAVHPIIVSSLSVGRPGRVYIIWLWTWMSLFSVTSSPPVFYFSYPSKANAKRLLKQKRKVSLALA